MRAFIILLCTFIAQLSVAQAPFTTGKYDQHMLTGLGWGHLINGNNPNQSYFHDIDFGCTPPCVQTVPLSKLGNDKSTQSTCNQISDSSGNLLFWIDKTRVFNSAYETVFDFLPYLTNVLNTPSLNRVGNKMSCIVLPISDTLYRVFVADVFTVANAVNNSLWLNDSLAIFDVGTYNQKIISFDIAIGSLNALNVSNLSTVIADSLEISALSATRHANGRDWLIPIFKRNSPDYYMIRTTPENNIVYQRSSGVASPFYVFSAGFTPQGNKFIKYTYAYKDLTLEEPIAAVLVYDFDRCEGYLYNGNITILNHNPSDAGGNFTTFSRNGNYVFGITRDDYLNVGNLDYKMRILNINNNNQLMFYKDIFNYTQANLPLYEDPIHILTRAYDGNIYYFASDSLLFGVDVENFDIDSFKVSGQPFLLPQRGAGRAHPTFANFHLGPLDGSLCDTLGIDNHPKANFKYLGINQNPLKVNFEDLALYDPHTWAWSFGDGAFSSDTSPTHVFPAPGIYNVCQTVSNDYSSDTYCQDVYVGVSSAQDAEAAELKYWPNPANNLFHILLPPPYNDCRIHFYDNLGRLVEQYVLLGQFTNRFDISTWPQGVYHFQVTTNQGQRIGSGHLVKE